MSTLIKVMWFLKGPEGDGFPWDGVAEQWFETIEDYSAVYARSDRMTRADTLANTSGFQRLVVEENEIPV